MGRENKIKIALINRYYPPNQSITGDSVAELASFLINKSTNFDVHVVSINADYKGKLDSSKTIGTTHLIKSFYNGNSKLFRFLANFLEGYQLIKKAIKIKSDIIICLTDPPLVNFWAGVLCKKSTTPWVLWSMDIYPDAFVSAGLVSENNLIYNYLQKRIIRNPPDYLITLGEVQKKYLFNTFNKEIEHIILPCGIHNTQKSNENPEWRTDDDKIYFAYAGNLGEAHSDRFLSSFIASMDKKKHQLILSVYGAKSSKILSQSNNKDYITLVDRLNKPDFPYIDIHIVSLLPQWTNVCVPSKAVSAICAESTMLFNGIENSDTSKMFDEASWIINSDKDLEIEKEKIIQFFNSINKTEIDKKRDKAKLITKKLNADKLLAFEKLSTFIAGSITTSDLYQSAIYQGNLDEKIKVINPKISIITICYNSAETIEDTLKSVINQNYPNIEYIIIDGLSKDGTLAIVNQYKNDIDKIVSEKDKGLFDALNKGIEAATGDIIGFLHSDDIFENDNVLTDISNVFKHNKIDASYSDLVYVDKYNTKKIIRNWISGEYKEDFFYKGWMLPHPTFYVRKEIYKNYGNFNLKLKHAADYEIMLRFIHKHKIKLGYLPQTTVRMRVGGVSNGDLKNRIKANREDKMAWRINGLKPKSYTLLFKPLSKIGQYLKLIK